jgi:hypothetical protein
MKRSTSYTTSNPAARAQIAADPQTEIVPTSGEVFDNGSGIQLVSLGRVISRISPSGVRNGLLRAATREDCMVSGLHSPFPNVGPSTPRSKTGYTFIVAETSLRVGCLRAVTGQIRTDIEHGWPRRSPLMKSY